ncbi:recombinase RecF [Rhodococcus sp. PAMC28707]|uniref:AAA family ATPase n=1 Tax=unclassified Rhodococcus (in: high G+C Gram-positive bacteria) TaxID=192944 RepID=UPI00109E1AEE|nr:MULTISPECIES: AAA family ATPase [unclassified Rhodococcus (in: high G+C Gram-positive bacteria)]QCB52005.1 recombinase RecF [Rhodococcus sp. PAMC28705]QCB59827.1 recombinase RecF [Rhodococcus sp. PAMC28707]
MTGTDEAVDRPLVEVVFDAIDADNGLADDAKYLVLAALEGTDQLSDQLDGVTLLQTRRAAQAVIEKPVGAFLTSIEVAGFRGIGPKSELKLHPAPGITIVSGRNGSGKSSFAEALEFAVTGKSYRWENKAKLWKDTWRNLHESSQCQIRVGLTIEGSEPAVVGVDWSADALLPDNSTWTQIGKAKRSPGTNGLGWKSAIELHRPILSYDEIGGLIEDSPSTLYDALAKLLGLDEIADAEKRLASALKDAKVPRGQAKEALAQLKHIVGESTDDRAQSAATLLKKRAPDVDAVQALATGSAPTQSSALSGLRAIVGLAIPLKEQVDTVVVALREAIAGTVDLASDALAIVERRNALLMSALELHADTGTTDCPVCETGTLDDAWAEHARTRMSDEEDKLTLFKKARRDFEDARRAATALIDDLTDATAVDGVELPSLESYQEAVLKVRSAPDEVTELAEHLSATLPAVVESGGLLRHEAAAAIKAREDTWAPIASRLASWVQMEQTAAKTDATVTSLEAAKKWMTSHAIDLRNQRLEPIAEQARDIWSELRQESNVDIGAISLEGTNTRRKAVLKGTVDGEPSEALSVMSQGELHALALALFIPRATTPNSPFRFIVLDDPIQAMDPAKIDGFIRVLSILAKTRQVVVFSHDDRLATAIRQLTVDARLLEVTRETGSKIHVKETLNQAKRYVDDVRALVKDEGVPDEVKRRVAPGLFRLAIESAAQQVFYAKEHRAGMGRQDTEQRWAAANKTTNRLKLAVLDDPEGSLGGWLSYRAERGPTLKLANAGTHGEVVTVDALAVKDLGRMVDGILAS